MAEAVGLSLAILGLAGNLKGCLDMFALFCSARDLGRDYTILSLKFDIEKALLLRWAERVRILRPDYDSRLNDETTLATISSILASIRLLLEDGTALQNTYGLRPVDVSRNNRQSLPSNGLVSQGPHEGISNTMMQRFTEDFGKLCLKAKLVQKTTNTAHKFLWVIGRKEKFDKFVSDLAHFVSKLDQVIPARDNWPTDKLTDEIALKIYGLMPETSRHSLQAAFRTAPSEALSSRPSQRTQLRLVRNAGRADGGDQDSSVLADLADTLLKKCCEDIILHFLWFRTMQERRDLIAPAHSKTLGWALDLTSGTAGWDHLPTWLASGTGAYWVSGKAGSGKSTLMKYIHNHKRTLALLGRWANGKTLIMGSFFFWGLGTPEQKTQNGLSRALLYHVLERHPTLIPRLLPEIWREVYFKNEGLGIPSLVPLSDANLRGAFDSLPSALSENSLKLCLFIDGLDEYEGNYHEGIRMILGLSQSPDIKIVVSSRPIPPCITAFSSLPKICLQDLNRRDITEYVNSTLGAHPYMTRLREYNDAACKRLLDDLIDRASGVFLWIILACRSVLDGLDSTDRINELRARIEDLPPELEKLFEHMLSRIAPRYHNRGAQLLKLVHHYQIHSSRGEVGKGRGDMSALTLAILEDADFKLSRVEFRPTSQQERSKIVERIAGRLRSRTGGLLELSHSPYNLCFCDSGFGQIFGDPNKQHNKWLDSHVQFMHRTVLEFLSIPGTWERVDCLRAPTKDGFDADLVFRAMEFVETNLVPGRYLTNMNSPTHNIITGLRQATARSRQIDQAGSDEEVMEIGSCIHRLHEAWIPVLSSKGALAGCQTQCPPLEQFVVEAGLFRFLQLTLEDQQKPAAQQDQMDERHATLLYHALIQPFIAGLQGRTASPTDIQPSSDIVVYLLSQGCHPNDKPNIIQNSHLKSVWELWLGRLEKVLDANSQGWDHRETARLWLPALVDITDEMIKHGADPGVLLSASHSNFVDGFEAVLLQYDRHDAISEGQKRKYHSLRNVLEHSRRSRLSDGTAERERRGMKRPAAGVDQDPKRGRYG